MFRNKRSLFVILIVGALLSLGALLLLMPRPCLAQSLRPAENGGAGDPAEETRDDMRQIGAAMAAYVSSGGGLWAPNSAQYCVWSGFDYDRTSRPVISHADLEALLVPTHLDALPEFDAWGNAYEFQLSPGILVAELMAVLSPGADGQYSATTTYAGGYTVAPEDDLIWADYFFVRQPPVPMERYRQQAEEEMTIVGSALLSWLVDQVGSAEAGFGAESEPAWSAGWPPDVTLDPEHRVDHVGLLERLMPGEAFVYTRCAPQIDPWGREYDYYVHPNLLLQQVLAIRSAGADQKVEGATYDFAPVTNPDGDLVWADGLFYRFPALFVDGFESGDLSAWSETEP